VLPVSQPGSHCRAGVAQSIGRCKSLWAGLGLQWLNGPVGAPGWVVGAASAQGLCAFSNR